MEVCGLEHFMPSIMPTSDDAETKHACLCRMQIEPVGFSLCILIRMLR